MSACLELRLPTIARAWPELAATADREGWPAARFLAALPEHELADLGHAAASNAILPRHACRPARPWTPSTSPPATDGQGNPRALLIMAAELLEAAAQREARQIATLGALCCIR